MSFFKNLFSCTCHTNTNTNDIVDLQNENKTINNRMNVMNNNNLTSQNKINQNIHDLNLIRTDILKIQDDVKQLNRIHFDTHGELKRMEDKLNNHFSILSNKIENVIMILNTQLRQK